MVPDNREVFLGTVTVNDYFINTAKYARFFKKYYDTDNGND